ncbi:MAG: indole-3-glycerol phosphate synthase TrpC [Neisseria sp.]|nr:indole-3-glycerol phosphate synthase TrpC [Neisseria sp.]
MSDILSQINRTKRLEVDAAQAAVSLADIRAQAADVAPPRGFLAAIHAKHQAQRAAVIAEIKKASPSKGLIREDFQPAEIARAYERAGAACLSVLTDETYFQGSAAYLEEARAAVQLPALRKDFMIDPYQIYQARAWGADAVLLIAASLNAAQLQEMEGIAHELGMDVLVELHDADEWQKCEKLTSPLFGVNNRNLRTFAVDTEQTLRLLPLLAGKTVVCESGIASHQDIAHMRAHGVHTFLVGESLMRQENIESALRLLLSE